MDLFEQLLDVNEPERIEDLIIHLNKEELIDKKIYLHETIEDGFVLKIEGNDDESITIDSKEFCIDENLDITIYTETDLEDFSEDITTISDYLIDEIGYETTI